MCSGRMFCLCGACAFCIAGACVLFGVYALACNDYYNVWKIQIRGQFEKNGDTNITHSDALTLPSERITHAIYLFVDLIWGGLFVDGPNPADLLGYFCPTFLQFHLLINLPRLDDIYDVLCLPHHCRRHELLPLCNLLSQLRRFDPEWSFHVPQNAFARSDFAFAPGSCMDC